MIQIDVKDLCVFEQLLKEKLERLSRGVDLTQHSKSTHLYRNFVCDFNFSLHCMMIYVTKF